jgi:hypothetical protein
MTAELPEPGEAGAMSKLLKNENIAEIIGPVNFTLSYLSNKNLQNPTSAFVSR